MLSKRYKRPCRTLNPLFNCTRNILFLIFLRKGKNDQGKNSYRNSSYLVFNHLFNKKFVKCVLIIIIWGERIFLQTPYYMLKTNLVFNIRHTKKKLNNVFEILHDSCHGKCFLKVYTTQKFISKNNYSICCLVKDSCFSKLSSQKDQFS